MVDRLFETGSRRDNDKGKAPLNKLPWAALKEVALVHKYGDESYGVGNWRKGQYFTVLADSALRHLTAFLECEDIDKKSQLRHLAHSAWNILVLLYETVFYSKYKKLDDRLEADGSWHSVEFGQTDYAKKLENPKLIKPTIASWNGPSIGPKEV